MSALASSSDPCSDWKALKTPIPGRRIWKKTKERTETIWPPLLETALVEALDKYRPAKSHRDTRLLRRFPKRNRFISDHIFSVTGTRRTAKQVGSRLQQMRDTCEDERILNLISRREYSEELDSDAAELALSSTASSPASWTSDVIDAVNCTAYSGLAAGPPPRTFVTIELVQPSSSSRSRIFTPVVAKSTRSNQQRISLEYPPEIANTGPMLTFTTPRRISTANYYSHFQVLIGGAVVHSEITALVLTPSATPASHIYSTELIPQFWAHLCRTAPELFQNAVTSAGVLPAISGDGSTSTSGISKGCQTLADSIFTTR
ncbi:hypothetical protein FB451DRAFT_1393444 [Mycena latifolia]|nr:hypothetical protein FB451DRAFT_1393444 [Mycena latifolia]